jgi:transposase
MTSTTHRPESTAAALDVGCERRTKEWRLTRSTAADARRQRARVGPGDREAVPRVLAAAKARAGVAADAPVRSCSEAGRAGFWPHRVLTALGVTNLVVDSSSIEVPRRARRAKTDVLFCFLIFRPKQRSRRLKPALYDEMKIAIERGR